MDKLMHEKLKELSERFAPPEEYTHGLAISETCQEFGLKAQAFWAQEFSSILQYIADEIERYYIPRPRDDDGKPWMFGDEFEYENLHPRCEGYMMFEGEWYLRSQHSQEFKASKCSRPTPKVYDADGVECKRGDEVWDLKGLYDVPLTVLEPNDGGSVKVAIPDGKGYTGFTADQLTHERPVFDAEGVRIRKDDTVWDKDCDEYKVEIVSKLNGHILISNPYGQHWVEPKELTHREPDSLEKLRDDIAAYSVQSPTATDDIFEWRDRLTALIERGA